MIATLKEIYNYYVDYSGHSKIIYFYLFSLVVLMFSGKEKRKMIVYPSLLIMLVILNPFCYKYIWIKLLDYSYWRMMWMIPIAPVIATAIVSLVERCKKNTNKIVILIIPVVLIAILNTNIYSTHVFEQSTNKFKISEETIDVCNFIDERVENPVVILPASMFCTARQYKANIKLVYGRDAFGFVYDISNNQEAYEIFKLMSTNEYDSKELAEKAKEYGVNCIVLKSEDARDFSRYGYILVNCVDGYNIYVLDEVDSLGNSIENGDYVITQYQDETGSQSNFYTITSDDKLIIIDGGWAENEQRVRDVIAENDNHVDAWIVSHPHKDHAGAINQILSDPQGITIDKIYDNGYDYDYIESVGEPFDDITVMERFYQLTNDKENLIHLHRGDVEEVCGLEIEVLNAYDDIIKENVGEQGDYQNNASLCLKIKRKNGTDTFLYTADIKLDMNDYIEENLLDEFKCTYVQVSHHGNWGISENIYDKTGAKAFFIDSPTYLIEDAGYPVHDLVNYFQDKENEVLIVNEEPNRVVLK